MTRLRVVKQLVQHVSIGSQGSVVCFQETQVQNGTGIDLRSRVLEGILSRRQLRLLSLRDGAPNEFGRRIVYMRGNCRGDELAPGAALAC